MDRRSFLRGVAIAAGATVPRLSDSRAGDEHTPNIEGYTLVCRFQHESIDWKAYEDLRTRDGLLILLSPKRHVVLAKSAEATFAQAEKPYLGLDIKEIGMAGPDLLADKLLERGDPDAEQVRLAAPPLGSAIVSNRPGSRPAWNTFVGTKECFDTMPVFPAGNTRTYHPNQYFPELNQALAEKRYEGLLGGWMPALRKVMPISDTSYYESVIFGDVEATDKFIVQTWHRTALVEDGAFKKVVYGYSYPAFPPFREDPQPEHFYRALLIFADYWERQINDMSRVTLPDERWHNMSRHAFAKELMVRPGGVYPKYGAVDRDYYGSEYDGFQDVFTSAVYTNLEWHRFEQARSTIENYFTDFVDARGAINMRGPETAQFGLTLSLLAKYFSYTHDKALLLKHGKKIEATANALAAMHDASRKLPADDPGYGLIHGWSESDACLAPQPQTWWQPYFANSAFASRGLSDVAPAWVFIHGTAAAAQASAWQKHAEQLRRRVIESVRANVRHDMKPPYIGPLPGTKLTFRESLATEHPSPQQWPHRPYSELLQADILPLDLANLVIDCMRAYGATTLGVVANVGRPNPNGRAILGFISYGYAQALLRLDRIEEFLLFLYSHGFHDHTPGSWTAGEVSGITGGTALFCIPAQQTIPLLLRWMLVLQDPDVELLYLARGIPRAWLVSGKAVQIESAPTRWGDVSFALRADPASKRVSGEVSLPGKRFPAEIEIRFRLPKGSILLGPTINGRAAHVAPDGQTVLVPAGSETRLKIDSRFS